MANWKYKLRLGDLRKKFEANKMTAAEFGKKVAERIRKQPWFKVNEDELEPIADEFEGVSDIEEFDAVLDTLYDWGDTTLPTPKEQMPVMNKVCWVDMMGWV